MTLTTQQAGHARYRARKANDPLTDRQLDAIVLDAILDGCDGAAIQARLRDARELAAEGCVLDERGRLQWLYG
jgi:DNA-binding response OmpR family regulator